MSYFENNCVVRKTTLMSRKRNIQLIPSILNAGSGESRFLRPLPEPRCWPGHFRMTFTVCSFYEIEMFYFLPSMSILRLSQIMLQKLFVIFKWKNRKTSDVFKQKVINRYWVKNRTLLIFYCYYSHKYLKMLFKIFIGHRKYHSPDQKKKTKKKKRQ